jgi:hypothetical protein
VATEAGNYASNGFILMLPSHHILHFTPAKNGSNALVSVKKEIDDETFALIASFLDQNFKRNGKHEQWLVKADEATDLCHAVEDIVDDVEDDEADDELIQQALGRRFKSQSSGKIIEEEKVDDSEDEDVISVGRRLRHVYRRLHELEKRLEQLEVPTLTE